MRAPFYCVLLMIAAALPACSGGGGGGGSTTNPIQGVSPGGIWHGTDSASGLAITGLIDETGFGEFMRADNAVFQGQVSTSGSDSISVDADGYAQGKFPDGSQHGTWKVTGTIQERQSISASTEFTTDAGTSTQGTLDLTFDPLYNQPSSLATVAGGYTNIASDLIGIASDGSISGIAFSQGSYSGQFSVVDPAYNLYRVQLTMTANGGPGGNWEMNGLATMEKTRSPTLLLIGLATGSTGTAPYGQTWCLQICQ